MNDKLIGDLIDLAAWLAEKGYSKKAKLCDEIIEQITKPSKLHEAFNPLVLQMIRDTNYTDTKIVPDKDCVRVKINKKTKPSARA